MRHRLVKTVGLIGLVCVIIVSVGQVPTRAGEENIEALIKAAKTKADHEALAAHYEKAAKEMWAETTEHRNMAAAYEKVPGSRTPAEHCKVLAEVFARGAAENEALAKIHREMAATAKE